MKVPVRPLAAVSVDLDEIPCYAAIHGLKVPEHARHAIYRKAVPRFRALFAELGIPATFFVIGRDVAAPGNDAVLRGLLEGGHELGNHSHGHLYDLTRRDRETIRGEIATAGEALERVTGVSPRGFRAPGYTVTDTVLDVLHELGYAYDSSVFPCGPYYGAKAAALAAIALRGRRSHSILDDPRVLAAPADPYRVGRPYWRRGRGLLELPVGVTRTATGRLPYIGTSVALAGTSGARLLTRMIRGRPLVNLELHGIDLADAAEDGLGFLRPHQPDLRKPRRAKEAALRAALEELRRTGHRFVTLSEAAEQFA
ncbi:MAG: polysaccharide deacetylase family protein [Myxococcota bacterium]